MSDYILLQIGSDLAFQLHGFSAELAAAVRDRLGYYLTDRPPTSCQPLMIKVQPPPPNLQAEPERELYSDPPLSIRQSGSRVVLKLPGMVCWCDPKLSFAGVSIAQPELIPVPVAYFTTWVLIALLIQLAQGRGWIGLHAAAVVADGRAILLPGHSGAGKSTIFGNARAAGLGVLSDDLVWLREGKGTFSVVPFPSSSAAAAPTVDEVPLAAIVCPSIVAQADNQILPISAREALAVLTAQGSFVGTREWLGERFTALVRAARSVPCFRLEAGRDQASVPALLVALVSS